MADTICKVLRDGALEGEHAQALTIKDSIQTPFGLNVFDYVLSQLSSYILAGKSPSRGLVVVIFSRSPSYYVKLLEKRGIDIGQSDKWFRILDCYSDPLGWKHKLQGSGCINSRRAEASVGVTMFSDVRDLDKLLCEIVDLGKGMVENGKDRFCVAIDSVTEMLRNSSLSSVSSLLSSLRSHGQVSSVFWLLHSDLHDARANAIIEYMSSIVASVEGTSEIGNGPSGSQGNLSLLEQNAQRGKFNARIKRRNGRVRLMSEELLVKRSEITFTPVSSEGGTGIQTLLPKLQFNLELTEKEQMDRSKVVLPFEHQERDKAQQIYDGRHSGMNSINEMPSSTEKTSVNGGSGIGEIIYLRDSDDERPDSDEDPDDDLDI